MLPESHPVQTNGPAPNLHHWLSHCFYVRDEKTEQYFNTFFHRDKVPHIIQGESHYEGKLIVVSACIIKMG